MAYVLLAVIGVCSGIIGALVGLGGGAILVPAALFISSSTGILTDLTPQKVVGLSVVMMIATGLSSTLSYMKSKTVDYKSGLIFFIGSAPGTILGAYVNKGINLPSFNLYFGILLIVLAAILLFRDYMKPVQWFVQHGKKRIFVDEVDGKSYEYGYPLWFAVSLTFLIGFASGLFGIGGGSMIVPAMIILFLFPPHVAIATSMFMVFLSSIINSASHIYLGHVPWLYVLPVVPGAYIGAKIGAALNKKIDSKMLVVLLRIILLLLGIHSIYEGIVGN